MGERVTDTDRETAIRTLARKLWVSDGEIEIDDNAKISEGEEPSDNGAYVQAWVWVDFSGSPLSTDTDE
jgi:hypothetical protein